MNPHKFTISLTGNETVLWGKFCAVFQAYLEIILKMRMFWQSRDAFAVHINIYYEERNVSEEKTPQDAAFE
ncbi:CLUMA_CG009729, isoform A [Clunio marinus]|uniref:CLUMA_CG009729, isoform A n=1 Tax=Clunio marinus TaxID=568069 RepID=A0A1J1IBF5_9DIPT|nr:CLUMA_CG009729, isoform A [Clunio marinus]